MYNILICDDEQDIVNALKIYLANPDYHLLEAHTGQEALDALERKDIQMCIRDRVCTTPRLKLRRDWSMSQPLRRFCQPRMASK